MKTLFSKLFVLTLIFSIITPSVLAHADTYRSWRNRNYNNYQSQNQNQNRNYNYQPYTLPVVPSCTDFSSASVGVSNLNNGINLSIASNDSALQSCIKNKSWLPYFTQYWNNVVLNISNTTLGVQILATSSNATTVSDLQNAGWRYLITGVTNYNYNYNNNYNYNQNYNYNNNYNQNYNRDCNCNYQYQNNNSNRTYRSGTSVFWNTNQIVRSLYNTSNGVQMYFTSPDYNTMLFLQWFAYSNLFSYLSGISITLSNIAWGVQVTVTAGSSSTIQEIQNIAYALVYQ